MIKNKKKIEVKPDISNLGLEQLYQALLETAI